MEYLYVKMTPDFKKKLTVLAGVKGQTVSDITRECLAKWIAENSTEIKQYAAEINAE